MTEITLTSSFWWIERKEYVKCAAGGVIFIIATRTFNPNSAIVGLYNAFGNRQPQPHTSTTKSGFAAAVIGCVVNNVKAIKYIFLLRRVDTYAGVFYYDHHITLLGFLS